MVKKVGNCQRTKPQACYLWPVKEESGHVSSGRSKTLKTKVIWVPTVSKWKERSGTSLRSVKPYMLKDESKESKLLGNGEFDFLSFIILLLIIFSDEGIRCYLPHI